MVPLLKEKRNKLLKKTSFRVLSIYFYKKKKKSNSLKKEPFPEDIVQF